MPQDVFYIGNERYDIPPDLVKDFLTDNPEAEKASTYSLGQEEYAIPTSLQKSFIDENPDAKSANDSRVGFDEDMFKSDMDFVQTDAENRLKTHYGRNDIRVELRELGRTAEEQDEYIKTGASRTPISLHNFNAAADFDIYIGGEKVRATGKSDDVLESTEPYQILGGVAKDKGYFWGWPWDSGHVAQSRFVHELFELDPELANTDSARSFYEQHSKNAPKTLEPVLSLMDNIYGTPQDRTYEGDELTKDPLLDPISVETDDDVLAVADDVLEQEVENATKGKSDVVPGWPFTVPAIASQVDRMAFEQSDIGAAALQSEMGAGAVAEMGYRFLKDEEFMSMFAVGQPEGLDPKDYPITAKGTQYAQQFLHGFATEATLGYLSEDALAPLDPAEGFDEVLSHVSGQFVGMLFPLSKAMKIAQYPTRLIKWGASKIPVLRKSLTLAKVTEGGVSTSKLVVRRTLEGGTTAAIGFTAHGQAYNHNGLGTLEQRMKEVMHSIVMGYGFGGLGALSTISKLVHVMSYPAMGALGYEMVPDDPNDPMNGDRKLATAMAMVAMHGAGHNKTVEARNYLKEVIDKTHPNATAEAKENIIKTALEIAQETVESAEKSPHQGAPVVLGAPQKGGVGVVLGPDGKPVGEMPALSIFEMVQRRLAPFKEKSTFRDVPVGEEGETIKTSASEILPGAKKPPKEVSFTQPKEPATVEDIRLYRELQSETNRMYDEYKRMEPGPERERVEADIQANAELLNEARDTIAIYDGTIGGKTRDVEVVTPEAKEPAPAEKAAVQPEAPKEVPSEAPGRKAKPEPVLPDKPTKVVPTLKGLEYYDELPTADLKNIAEGLGIPVGKRVANRRKLIDKITRASTEDLELEHYSSEKGLTMLDPNKEGSGVLGDHRKLMKDPNYVKGTWFYIGGTAPEKYLANETHRYQVKVQRQAMYDFNSDPDGLRKKHKNDRVSMENEVKEAGYEGGIYKLESGQFVARLFNISIPTKVDYRARGGKGGKLRWQAIGPYHSYMKIGVGAIRDADFNRFRSVEGFQRSSIYREWTSFIDRTAELMEIPITRKKSKGTWYDEKTSSYYLEPSENIYIKISDVNKVKHFADMIAGHGLQAETGKFRTLPQSEVYIANYKANGKDTELRLTVKDPSKMGQLVDKAREIGIPGSSVEHNVLSIGVKSNETGKLGEVVKYAKDTGLFKDATFDQADVSFRDTGSPFKRIARARRSGDYSGARGDNLDKVVDGWREKVQSYKVESELKPEYKKPKVTKAERQDILDSRRKALESKKTHDTFVKNAIAQGKGKEEASVVRAIRGAKAADKLYKEMTELGKDKGIILAVEILPGFNALRRSMSKWRRGKMTPTRAAQHDQLSQEQRDTYEKWVEGGRNDRALEERLEVIQSELNALNKTVKESPSTEEIIQIEKDFIEEDRGVVLKRIHVEQREVAEVIAAGDPDFRRLKFEITGKESLADMSPQEMAKFEIALKALAYPDPMAEQPKMTLGQKLSPKLFTQARNRVTSEHARAMFDLIEHGDALKHNMSGEVLEQFRELGLHKLARPWKSGQAERLADLLEGKAEPRGPEEAKMVSSYREILDAMIKTAEESGIDVAGYIENYFPRMIKGEFLDIIYGDIITLQRIAMKHSGGDANYSDKVMLKIIDESIKKKRIKPETIEAIKHLMETGQASDITEAFNKIKLFSFNDAFSPFGNIEMSRVLELPTDFYERNAAKVLARYTHGWSKRVAEVEMFGKNGEKATELYKRTEIYSPDEARVAWQVLESWTGEINKNPQKMLPRKTKKALASWTQFEVITKIGGGLATIPNMFQTLYSVFPVVPTKAYVKGVAKTIASPKMRSRVRRSGAPTDTALRTLAGYETGGLLGKVTDKILGMHFTPTNKFNSFVSAATAEVVVKDYYKVASRSKDTRARRVAQGWLEKFGFDYKQEPSDQQIMQFMYRFATDQQLMRNVLRDTLSMNDPRFRALWLYKKFTTKQAQLVKDNMKAQWDVGGVRGTTKYITKLGAAGVISGEMVIWMKNHIKSFLSDEEYYRDEDTLWERLINDLAAAGSIGIFTDIVQSGTTGDEKIRDIASTAKFVATPTQLSTAIDATEVVGRFAYEIYDYGIKGAAKRSVPRIMGLFGTISRQLGLKKYTPSQKEGRARFQKGKARTQILDDLGNGDVDAALGKFFRWNTNRPMNPITLEDIDIDEVQRRMERKLEKRMFP